MGRILAVALALWAGTVSALASPYAPTEEAVASHIAEVYRIANEYVVRTFNLRVTEASEFHPVRFNSTGVWGGFESRVKELGGNRYEVQGWLVSVGTGRDPIVWSAVVEYRLEDPEAWRYRWVNRDYVNVPEVTGWKFGAYKSVPYDNEYADNVY